MSFPEGKLVRNRGKVAGLAGPARDLSGKSGFPWPRTVRLSGKVVGPRGKIGAEASPATGNRRRSAERSGPAVGEAHLLI